MNCLNLMYWWYYYKQAVFQCILLRRRSDASKPNCYRSTNNDIGLHDANRYITEHGLQFNPKKTECVIFGRSTLQPHPEWELNGTKLTETDSVTYLGVTLSYVKPSMHVDNRI